jgi:hypothetical protein
MNFRRQAEGKKGNNGEMGEISWETDMTRKEESGTNWIRHQKKITGGTPAISGVSSKGEKGRLSPHLIGHAPRVLN